jgi:ClpP class serine protease
LSWPAVPACFSLGACCVAGDGMWDFLGSGWFWLVVIILSTILGPTLAQAWTIVQLEKGRRRRVRSFDKRLEQLERKRRARIIALVHREETWDYRSIDIEDSEDILAAIRDTPANRPIEIVLHTPGGMALASLQIARALKAHAGRKTVFVPHWAMSGGTLIALAADEVVMGEHAVLGPVDPQLPFGIAAVSMLKPLAVKSADAVSDQTIIFADIAKKALAESRKYVCDLLIGQMSENGACSIADDLISGKYSHGYPITVEAARDLGLNVSTDMPREITDLLELFPRRERNPSVRYARR